MSSHGEYGMSAAMDRNRALGKKPLSVSPSHIDASKVYEAERSIAVWVRLHYSDAEPKTVKGFAEAWTREHVRVQYVDMWLTEPIWVEAKWVRRRELPDDRKWYPVKKT